MSSTRTQIYLTDEQRRRLDERGRREGHSLAHMVREAVEVYLAGEPDLQAALDATFGAIPDLEVPSRDAWDARERERMGDAPAR
ncbi:MAG: ribbon-helix-helix protein, CopG family [Chloroflexi bacterium]|nr:ribbon-helix-helix protein, CopG family [Chloroflexota bacterium]